MPELQFNTYEKLKHRKAIPNANEMAKKLIEANTHLFVNCPETAFKMSVMMQTYALMCSDAPKEDLSLILNDLNNLKTAYK